MRNRLPVTLVCLLIPATAGAQSVARGQYIVERVGMCQDYLTPRDEKGQLILAKSLQGATLAIQPVHPMPWSAIAPPIAGLPVHYRAEQMTEFLETGKRPDGSLPRPPTPPYRLSHDDALSVTMYLKTINRE